MADESNYPSLAGSNLPSADNAQGQAVVARAAAEVQGQMVIAKRFPRDQRQARDRIIQACQRTRLAEQAAYQYPRGGQKITGASIRLAEVMLQNWGNMIAGIVDLGHHYDSGEPFAEAEAYCLDLETNVRNSTTFRVSLVRHTRQGTTILTDPRDIYEQIANQGARRKRAMILATIPGDIEEEALEQCQTTVEATIDVTPEGIKSMLAHFASEYGVTKEQIETRYGRRADSLEAAELIAMRNIAKSLRDGFSAPGDWFPAEKQAREAEPKKPEPADQGERLAAKLEDQTAAPGERRDAPASGGTTQGGRPTPDMDTARLEAFATLKRDIAQMRSAETEDVLSIGNLIAAGDDLTDEQRAVLHDALHERVKELKV